MQKILISITLGVLLLVGVQSPPALAGGAGSDAWYAGLRGELGGILCTGDLQATLVDPYRIDSKECSAFVTSLGDACYAAYKPAMPADVTTEEEGQKWGSTLGECIGNIYDVLMQARAKQ